MSQNLIYAFIDTNDVEKVKKISVALGGNGEVENVDDRAWMVDVGQSTADELFEKGYIETKVEGIKFVAETP